MDFSEYINFAVGFCQAYPFIAISIGIFLVYLLYRKPKFFLSVLTLVLGLVMILHFIFAAASSSSSVKKELIEKNGIHKED